MKRIWKNAVCLVCVMALLSGCGSETLESEQNQTEGESQETVSTAEQEKISSVDGTSGTGFENLLENGDFSLGTKHWGVYLESGGDGQLLAENGAGALDISSTGRVNYAVQLYYDGFALYEGGVYQLCMNLSSTVSRNATVRIQLNGGDYHAYMEEPVTIGPKRQTYVFSFTMDEATDEAPRLCLNLGTPDEEAELTEHVITISDAELVLLDDTKLAESEEIEMPDINVDQIGYLTNAVKTAVVRGGQTGTFFTIQNEAGDVVFSGELSEPVSNPAADEINCTADFSELTEAGTYTVKVGEAESYPFFIGDNVYRELLDSVLKMLYLQRCGMELTSEYAGEFAHASCHESEAVIYGTDQKKDVSGGWHDAGDYGRYVSPGAITAMDLMLTYEDHPELFDDAEGDQLGIPESGNGIPDILDEVKYELDWMLKMQEEETGGVYHKVTCRTFPGFVMPEEETEELVISPVSTTATGAFAAVMAKSAEIYRQIDSEFAEECLDAAEKAWSYLETHENVGSFVNPSDIVTGEYDDAEDADERFWAAAQLLKTTGNSKYAEYIESMVSETVYQGLGWADVGTYGCIACLSLADGAIDDEVRQKIQQAALAEAAEYAEASDVDGYGISLGMDYVWGSNMVVCNQARQMILAGMIDENVDYREAVSSHFHYILGSNPMSICYVTGFGTVSAENPHHRPSVALQKAMPGMVIGGPDSGLHDPCAEQMLAGEPPAKCYVDNDQSYSTNEITIYWNSPFIYVLADMLSENE